MLKYHIKKNLTIDFVDLCLIKGAKTSQQKPY